MRGDILHYDEISGIGLISAEDGNRYSFSASDFREDAPLAKGKRVDFTPVAGTATEIYLVVPAVSCSPPVSPPTDRSLSFWGYYVACVTTRYATFSGRARRKENWAFVVFNLLSLVLAGVIGFNLDRVFGFTAIDRYPLTIGLVAVCYLLQVVPGIALLVRRVHDIGLSGWFALLFLFLSFFSVGILVMLVVFLIPSQRHDNRWGPMPARGRRPPAPPSLNVASV